MEAQFTIRVDNTSRQVTTSAHSDRDHPRGAVSVNNESDCVSVVLGAPVFHDGGLAALARERGPAAAASGLMTHGSADQLARISGRYAIVVVDKRDMSALLVVDRFGCHPLCYHVTPTGFAISDRA